MTRLPNGWELTSINEIASFNPKTIADDSLDCAFAPMQYLGTRFRAQMNYEQKTWGEIKKSYVHFQTGDVIVAKVTPCFENGKAGIAPNLPNGIGAGSSEFCVFRPAQGINERYLLSWLSTEDFRRRAAVTMTGSVGLKRVPKEVFLSEEIPLAPEAEQRRISDKLDTTLARVDALNDRLARITPLLKRFRQSVLAAATSGRLTEDWRKKNSLNKNAKSVVEDDERRKSEFISINPSLERKKSSLNSNINENYKFDIPLEWVFSTWGKISEWITYGFTRPMPSTSSGYRLLTAKDVHYFDLRISESSWTTADAFSNLSDKDKPCNGDLLITKDGSIGRAVIVKTEEPFCINQSVAVCWLRSTSMNKNYLEIVANADFTQRFVLDMAKGMAIQHLSITDFACCPVPVPPLEEQTEIVRRVASLFAFADRLESRLQSAQTAAERLTPALLAKAFRGELVPQDPSDEPATELLRRLREARAAEAPTKPKRGRKAAAT